MKGVSGDVSSHSLGCWAAVSLDAVGPGYKRAQHLAPAVYNVGHCGAPGSSSWFNVMSWFDFSVPIFSFRSMTAQWTVQSTYSFQSLQVLPSSLLDYVQSCPPSGTC